MNAESNIDTWKVVSGDNGPVATTANEAVDDIALSDEPVDFVLNKDHLLAVEMEQKKAANARESLVHQLLMNERLKEEIAVLSLKSKS